MAQNNIKLYTKNPKSIIKYSGSFAPYIQIIYSHSLNCFSIEFSQQKNIKNINWEIRTRIELIQKRQEKIKFSMTFISNSFSRQHQKNAT